MNEPIKYMIVAGSIAALSMAVGVVVGWKLKSESQRMPHTAIVRSSPRPPMLPASMFLTNTANSPMTPHTRYIPISASNAAFRTTGQAAGSPHFVAGGMNYAAMQKVQNLPEVKQAREAAAEAQRKYFDAMRKAMESAEGRVTSGGKAGSGKAKVESGEWRARGQ